MEKLITYLKNKNIEIPGSINEIVNLFFGALVSDSVNYWFNKNCDFIDNKERFKPFERPDSDLAKKDINYRKIFSKLNNEEKENLKNLIKESLEGVLFSLFVKLDQSPIGDWKILLKEGQYEGIANSGTELHEDLYKWLKIFS